MITWCITDRKDGTVYKVGQPRTPEEAGKLQSIIKMFSSIGVSAQGRETARLTAKAKGH